MIRLLYQNVIKGKVAKQMHDFLNPFTEALYLEMQFSGLEPSDASSDS
jgi:hypothetical protein